MAVQYFVPGAGHVSLTATAQRQLPGGIFINANPPIVLVLASVDSDGSIYDGQTGVVILPESPSTFAASGNRVKIVQGAVTNLQTVTAEGTSSVTITANLTGMTIPGSATLYVGKPK